MKTKANIIIFGGSFNPFHDAHLYMIEYVKNHNPENIILVPTMNPLKKEEYLSLEQRINFLIEYFKDDPRVEVSRTCLNNPDHNYIYSLFAAYKDYNIKYVLGSDSYKTMHTWKNYQDWKDSVEFIVFKRFKDEMDGISFPDEYYERDISSSNIRTKGSDNKQNSKIIDLHKKLFKEN